MQREIIEVEPKPIVTLLSIQSGYNPKSKSISFHVQEIETQDVDHIYNIGNARIGKESFSKPFVVNGSPMNPILGAVTYPEDLDATIAALTDYFKNNIRIDLNNTVCLIETVLEAIESDKFDKTTNEV